MAEWTQEGFAVIAKSQLGGPVVLGFHPGREHADRQVQESRDRAAGFSGTVLERAMSSVRVVEAVLTFSDAEPG